MIIALLVSTSGSVTGMLCCLVQPDSNTPQQQPVDSLRCVIGMNLIAA